jgi:hypothetical protein
LGYLPKEATKHGKRKDVLDGTVDFSKELVADSLNETVLARDVLQMSKFAKPVLLRHLFALSATLPVQSVSTPKCWANFATQATPPPSPTISNCWNRRSCPFVDRPRREGYGDTGAHCSLFLPSAP